MLRIAILGLLSALAVCPLGTATAAETHGGPVDLFNGKDLAGWDCFLDDPNVKMEDVWSVRDGVLVCKGEPLGYLHTKKKFTNYKLIVEWRWAPGKEPGNSGVLLRIVGDAVSFLPKCVEAQLKSGDAGDIWGFYGAKVDGDQERLRVIKDHELLGDFVGVGKIKGAEKPPGEWNKYEITFDGGDLTLLVNGQKVNEATGCDVVPGTIGFQSEGGEIHFRTIKLVPLGKCPNEVRLFNGKDLSGWTYHLRNSDAKMEDVWSVRDGVLRCEGRPVGYLRTEKKYTNYVLKLEWRWPEGSKPGNNGVLLRVVGEDKVWPKSVEAQLAHNAAGDIWNIDKVSMKVDPERTRGRNTKKMKPSNEKPQGQWNEYEIILKGGDLSLKVNGEVQNTAAEVEEVPGTIALQSEGAPIEYRNIRLYLYDD
jgi:hypothetical protein